MIRNRTSPIYMTHIQTHHTLKLQIKIFLKGVIHRNSSIFLSRADFTRFQCNIFLSLIQLYVFNFLNLMQGDILTKAEKHFQVLKHTSLPLPIWYQDGLTKQWKSGKLILQRKRYACISPDGSNEISSLPLWKICPRGATSIQDREETAKSPRGGDSSTNHGGFKNFQEKLHSMSPNL